MLHAAAVPKPKPYTVRLSLFRSRMPCTAPICRRTAYSRSSISSGSCRATHDNHSVQRNSHLRVVKPASSRVLTGRNQPSLPSAALSVAALTQRSERLEHRACAEDIATIDRLLWDESRHGDMATACTVDSVGHQRAASDTPTAASMGSVCTGHCVNGQSHLATLSGTARGESHRVHWTRVSTVTGDGTRQHNS
jgi:hypothetical protein